MKKLCLPLYLILAIALSSACHSPMRDVSKQLTWLSENAPLWYPDELDDGVSPIGFTVTDLDQDGLLEISTATVQGTGLYTFAEIFEMSPSLDAITPLPLSEDDRFNFPDILGTETANAYYDEAAGEYHYIFHDSIRNGAAEHYDVTTALTLKDDDLVLTPLALREELYTLPAGEDEAIAQITYKVLDPALEDITLSDMDAYRAIAETAYHGLSEKQATFLWQMKEETKPVALDTATLYDLLEASYAGFSLK